LASFAQGCQWKWKLDYLEDRRSHEEALELDFGSAMHDTLEDFFSRTAPCTEQQAQEFFEKKLRSLYSRHLEKYTPDKKGNKPGEKDIVELVKSAHAILAYIKQLPELVGIEVVHNEYKLFESMDRVDGVDMKFKGYIDIVLKGKDKLGRTILWIVDFKTCSWGWDREKRDDRWRHYQLFLYKYYLCKKHNIDPKHVRTAFVLLKKRPSKGATPVEWFAISAGPVSVQRALEALSTNVTEMIEREKDNSFQKDRKKCHEYGRTCPYFDTPLCPNDPK
jgi:RecB family exonuclease